METKSLRDKHNFTISNTCEISREFLSRNILDFRAAITFIKLLPYKRNKNKYALLTLFGEGCGTCSTKHAVLKSLAVENSVDFVKLILGVFKMNGVNTPRVKATLENYNLDYIPEAHNYLRIENEILDCTRANAGIRAFKNDLLSEIEINPEQITDYKINYHKTFLDHWLSDQHIPYSLEKIWSIREECINALSN